MKREKLVGKDQSDKPAHKRTKINKLLNVCVNERATKNSTNLLTHALASSVGVSWRAGESEYVA